MPDPCSGFKDKLYWRVVANGIFHCFKRLAGAGGGRAVRCISLCQAYEIPRTGGQESRRPEPILRCGRCDGLEANRRGWNESGPTLEPRLGRSHG
jgi:hypothetical protein